MKRKSARKEFAFAILALFSFSLFPVDVLAKGGGGFSSRGGGFSSGGSRSSSSPSFSSRPSAPTFAPSRPSAPRSSPSSGSTPSSKTWSAPSAPMSKPETSSPKVWGSRSDQKPPASKADHDSAAARAMREQQSQKQFEQYKRGTASPTPGSTVGSAETGSARWSGSQQASDRTIKDLSRDFNYKRMQDRSIRQDNYYGGYYGRPAPFAHAYSDPFGNMFFWLWLFDRPQRHDELVYHRRNEIDPARYEELRRRDGDLDRRLAELEGKGVKPDSSYVPPEFKDNRDLMYSDDVVEKAYKEANKSSFPWFWTIGSMMLVGAVGYVVVTRLRVIKA